MALRGLQRRLGLGMTAARISASKKTMSVRSHLIAAGVKNLKAYGYPSVNAENILTDDIFKAFFRSMLEDNLGQGYDAEINALLKEIA